MKYVLITDTHFGIRQDAEKVSELFHDNMELFFKNVFWPYIRANQSSIEKIIHAGDVFDNRRRIATRTAERARGYFFEPLKASGLRMDIILGNHDVYYRETNSTNTISEFIKKSYTDIVNVYASPKLVGEFLYIPWINNENRDETMQAIQNKGANFIIGHLELQGFSFSKAQVSKHGDDPVTFKDYDRVFSGHYHFRQEIGNITYLGAPTQHTWIDVDVPCGFHVFDTDTGVLEFIANPYNFYENVTLDSKIEGDHPRYYRLHVNEEDKPSTIKAKMDKLVERNAINVKIVTKKSEKSVMKEGSVVVKDSNDTPTFIRSVVEDEATADILVKWYYEVLELSK